MDKKLFDGYIQEIEMGLASGQATELSYYPALKKLIEELETGVTAIVSPKQIECGAPDIIVTKGDLKIGYIEAKDIGKSLDEAEDSEQLKRYLEALPNLVLTNFIELRWFLNGKRQREAKIGQVEKGTKVKRDKAGIDNAAQLLEDFSKQEYEGVGTPQELAKDMARLAHRIREGVAEALGKKVTSELLTALYKAFIDTLIPDLPEDQFADMYAQTIAYGLFAARCEAKEGWEFTRDSAAGLIPKTNPFLRELFYQIAGPKLDDEPYRWAVDELVQLLRMAQMGEILKGFGRSTAKDDPVVYFYETFLKEYNPQTREMRGVYYTPLPVVSYIVRSIDYLLKNTFKRPMGLADPNVNILDPAAGTATFLYAVVNEIHEAMTKQGQQGMWNDYVAERLLPRLFGFELLMAPYAVAHLKLGLQLRDTGYKFGPEQRLGIYLTNTLEEAIKRAEMLLGQYIVKEANEAAEIKKDKPIMVVLGNPPYSGISANKGKWISNLIQDYKIVDGKPLGERKQWLQNDYVKFIRFGQWRIERTVQGILGFITDHSYLDSPTFRGMRQALINTFTDIYILDLHGDSRRRETAPDGSIDENVFDIQQGVAIALFVKEPSKVGSAQIYHSDIWGIRGEWPNPQPGTKYFTLAETDVSSTSWTYLQPASPFYLFVPRKTGLLAEYNQGWRVTDIYPVNSTGIQTSRDDVALDFSQDKLQARISELRDLSQPDHVVIDKYGLREMSFWRVSEARKSLVDDKDWVKRFVSCLYRPFDVRPIFYSSAFVHRTRYEVMRHLLEWNLVLCIGRAGQVTGSEQWDVIFCGSQVVDLNIFYRGGGQCFPLYLYPAEGEMEMEKGRRPNLNPSFVAEVEKRLGVRFSAHPPTPSPLATSPPCSPSPLTERGQGGEVHETHWRTDPELWARLKPLARQMRRAPTEAEKLLWQHLRNHQLSGFKFRRQHSIERFIADFYCAEAVLVVEVEGPVHQYQQGEDQIRQAYMESLGLRLLRFSNDDVIHNTQQVLRQISKALSSPSPLKTLPPTPPPLATSPPSPLSVNGEGLGGEVITPEDIFNYAYAVFHSPTYRRRYAELLKIDFPRLPLTSDKGLFATLANKGAELVALHLMESPVLQGFVTQYPVAGSNLVEKVAYVDLDKRVYINKGQYFGGVSKEVWEFHIGGYQVCEKWLKDRKGRRLSLVETEHYQRLVIAIQETRRIMKEIDILIPVWPVV